MGLKKIITYTIIILLIGIGVAIVVGSNQDRKVFFINKLQKPITNSIKAQNNKNYKIQILRLKGEVNDTIKVKPCKECQVIFLKGQISEKFRNDFQSGSSEFIIEPYKATSGNLKIVHKIR